MNPGLVVKLRPAGPWRIGPDSGARNRVDVIYHSDSLFSAITGAMARLGSLEEWLDATARDAAPAVCFSSCFPFLDDIGFVIPPRTIWPPTAPALMSARVRWKSARFVPLGIVQALLAGQTLDGSHWSVDGPSECLVPSGRSGPFRTGVRFNAAVDRLTGATERHSTACIEFRPGSGLWAVVSFRDEAARDRWADPVKAAFRWLADTGFGGERSRGWGRSETPEFIDGTLPEMVLPAVVPVAKAPAEPAPEPAEASVETPVDIAPLVAAPEPAAELGFVPEEITAAVIGPENMEPLVEPEPELAARAEEPSSSPSEAEAPAKPEPPAVEAASPVPAPQAPVADLPPSAASHWLLSLFSPAASDAVDWRRGNYTTLVRGGRIESPLASGELKKQLNMVAEGSVLQSASAPMGSAPDVAPDGFAHPVFRAGFALTIPLPHSEVS
jgi:CRISPR type III-A-associated RAMP protein Csm4